MTRMFRTHLRACTAVVCAAGLLAGLPAAAAGKPGYIGEWGIDAKSCKGGEAEVGITSSTFSSVDSECRIKSVSGGNGVWTFNLHKCQGDGVSKTATVSFKASAKRATMHYAGSTFSNSLVRCR
jgi:hypothetical protein